MTFKPGRHFLQIPGPTNVPDRVLRAIDNPTIDHRGPDFAVLAKEVLAGMKTVFQTNDPVIIYTASGTGGWEAALVNTLNPGDKVLATDLGQFAALWAKMAGNLGFNVELIPNDWRHGIDSAEVGRRLSADKNHEIKAVERRRYNPGHTAHFDCGARSNSSGGDVSRCWVPGAEGIGSKFL